MKINETFKLRSIRLEAATACQLQCPSCPTASGETGKNLGVGFLKFDDFKRLVDSNPTISSVELSNWGEIFLNKDLVKIIKYAYHKNVALYARNGANLNHISAEVLEALVKYRFRAITCSIDGASQETYEIYRVKGSFDQVISNIQAINKYKEQYESPYPELNWQYVVFGHNEHEIGKAKKMAADLKMNLKLKLSWDDFYSATFSPVKDKELIRREIEFGVADRTEFRDKYGREFMKKGCFDMWKAPQINYDGRLLGCSVNYWDDYGNVFKDGLAQCFNSKKMKTAKDMLMGKIKAQPGIPCSRCKVYQQMRKLNDWITPDDTKRKYTKSRKLLLLENKILGDKMTNRLVEKIVGMRQRVRVFHEVRRADISDESKGHRQADAKQDHPTSRLTGGIYPLTLPLIADESTGWKGYPLFSGRTVNISKLTCHASVLSPQVCPHPAHQHKEEELLVLLAGELDIILPSLKGSKDEIRKRLRAGQFLYYPANILHTIQTMSPEPAMYIMFKWYNQAIKSASTLPYDQFNILEQEAGPEEVEGMEMRLVFEGPTNCLRKLHGHVTRLAPGAGYDAHIDKHDVAIIMLKGEVQTLDKRVGPHSVIYYPAGEAHGMRNVGKVPAQYLVFEFHGRSSADAYPFVTLMAKSTDPRRWKKGINRVLNKGQISTFDKPG